MAGEEIYGVNVPKAYGYVPPQNEVQEYAPAAAQGITPPQEPEIPPELKAYLEQNIQVQSQPAVDTFQKSGPGLGTAALAGIGIGTAAGAGKYFLGTNPLDSDGIFKDGFLSQFDQKLHKMNVRDLTKELTEEAYTKLGIAGDDGYQAVKKLAQSAKIEDLADDLKGKLPAGLTSPEEAKKLVTKAETELKKAANQALQLADESSLNVLRGEVSNLKTLENKLTNLADDIPADKFKQFISDNKKLFKIEGTEDEIKKAVDTIAAKGKKGLLGEIKVNAKAMENSLSMSKTALNASLMSYYDDAAKTFHESSPKFLQEVLDSFKRNKALKTGGIAAAATAAALGIFFAINKSAKPEHV